MLRIVILLGYILSTVPAANADIEIEETGPNVTIGWGKGKYQSYQGRQYRVKGTGPDVGTAINLAAQKAAALDADAASATNAFLNARFVEPPVIHHHHHTTTFVPAPVVVPVAAPVWPRPYCCPTRWSLYGYR